MSHARMRAIFRRLLETRALSRRLGGPPHGLEACWVAPAIGLQPGDYTSVPSGDALLAWLTELGERHGAPGAAATRKVLASGGAAFAGSAWERSLCAVGAAMALSGGNVPASSVLWLSRADLKPAQWQRLEELALDTPLVVVVMPAPAAGKDLSTLVKASGTPVIPVDASDAIALYRVTQESLVRARSDRRGALLDCVAFRADPVTAMAAQLLARKVCTAAWIQKTTDNVKARFGQS